MAEEFGKMKCKTISFEIKFLYKHFLLYKFRKHNTAVKNTIQYNENMTYQKK
jgi:hypothetical protein